MDLLWLSAGSLLFSLALLALVLWQVWRRFRQRRLTVAGRRQLPSRRSRVRAIQELPFFMDLMVICLEAGNSLQYSIVLLAKNGRSGVLRGEFEGIVQNQQAGLLLTDALAALGQRFRSSSIDSFATICVSAQSSGADLVASLRDLALQCHEEQLFEAERRALQAPVRLLPPLLLFIFPCTFLILAFPIVVNLRDQGVL